MNQKLRRLGIPFVNTTYMNASTEFDRMFLGDARNFAVQGVLNFVGRTIAKLDQDISCHFDLGARDAAMPIIEKAWRLTNKEISSRAHFSYSSVERLIPLQAADMVAYEAYNNGLHLFDPKRYPENPHFVDLRNRANVAFYSLHEAEIRRHLSDFRASLIGAIKGLEPEF